MKEKDERSFDRLVEGSKYRIMSFRTREESMETCGIFKGYLYLGRDQALKIELEDDDKTIRLIPSHMVLYMEVIEQLEDAPKESKKSSSSYYG